ncbi:MAG: bifunctional rhamnulose-1-phosphate aldolase/short-chain dehydrogenase [Rhizomicrobium sp.]
MGNASFAVRALPFAVPAARWVDADAAGLSEVELLLYRSHQLGADLTVTNYGGGNTSAKSSEIDPLTGQAVKVLWVKGSGGDIGTMTRDGLASLYMDKLLGLEAIYRGRAQEDEMVGYLPHCTFNLNPRAASIDTPLHAYLPFAHVDHVHPDSVTALAASSEGEAITKKIWDGAVGWIGWQRPGFDLGLKIRDFAARNPDARGAVLANHGLICWGHTAKECYENTIGLIADVARYLNDRLAQGPAFGGPLVAPLASDARAAIAARLIPVLRGLMTGERHRVGHFSDAPEVLEFVGSRDFARLAPIGTSCPDHFLRTKIAPLALDPARIDDAAYLSEALETYRQGYAAYYARCAVQNDPKIRDANPAVVLLPGVGCMSFGADKTTARLAGEFYTNAINVMRGAETIGSYVGLPEKEAYGIEYWILEDLKLQRLPKAKSLAGRIALITGAAGGIGAATAERLLSEGCCVMLTDREAGALAEVEERLKKSYGKDLVRSAVGDVTKEDQLDAAFSACALAFGGIDIVVANAGIASSAAIEDTTVEMWNHNYDVLAQGYFLTARGAFRLMKRQQRGGAIVFIGSKNALAATPNASAYASAKAAALHLARCLALEGAGSGIRVNVVNPDAVIKGSRIWNGDWRKQRAGAYGIDEGEELEDFYRDRSMLKRHVLPADVAEAVYFFASDASAKSTGNILNVDAGVPLAFPR